MRSEKSFCFSEFFGFKELRRNGSTTTSDTSMIIACNNKIATINKSSLIFLIYCIEKTHHLTSKKRIITIQKHHNLTRFTFICYRFINIGQCKSVLLINNDLNLFLRDPFFLYVFFNIFSSFIWWGIININNMIIWVILHKYWIEISQIQSALIIVVRWNNNTKR